MSVTLPIDQVLPELLAALRAHKRAVLQAPPGAGKTTRVPLAMLEAGGLSGKIVMLEPRRLAARAAAERMAQSLGEKVGERVGYRIRGHNQVSRATRIEVVTEGILTRMLQADPTLSGIGAVIFDEYHERSLNADLGLALCLEISGALREDLQLLVMSATLDAAPVAQLLNAPIITSEGRSFPVETSWLPHPRAKSERFETGLADFVLQALSETTGGMLVFLPGEGEIRRVMAALSGRVPADVHLRPLYGAMDFAAQRAAIAPLESGRKLVLATAIAETSLTIEGIHVVVDGGLARRARFDPGSGMSRLVTEPVSRAEATQRAGRAGRVAPGRCFRFWPKAAEGALPAFPPAEIEVADLTGFALEVANWGASADALALLTPPPAGALAEAQALLQLLGALDDKERITAHGRALAEHPLHPRLAHMLVHAGRSAAPLAALLAARDPLRGAPVDLSLRLEALRDPRGFEDKRPYPLHRGTLEQIKTEARRLAKTAPQDQGRTLGECAALAYPDRIGLRRKGDAPRYVLSGGKGAAMDDVDPMAGARLIVATDLDGATREPRIRTACTLSEAELRGLYGDKIHWEDRCEWSKRDRMVVARQQERFGAVVLQDRVWKDVTSEVVARAMLDGVRDLGLRAEGAAARFCARVALGRSGGLDLPDMCDERLMETLEDWLLPYLEGVRTAHDWKEFDLLPALRAILSWEQNQALDQAVPAFFHTPLGHKLSIDYGGEVPSIEVRLQELFGVTTHPSVAGTPLRVSLLSPARRPVQVTMDLPGFWQSSYAEVRKEMRGRYPRHPWPEDPTQAEPTLKAKRKNT